MEWLVLNGYQLGLNGPLEWHNVVSLFAPSWLHYRASFFLLLVLFLLGPLSFFALLVVT